MSDAVSGKTLQAVAARLGHDFQRIGLLDRALTHPSISSHMNPDNQRLEFLGDRVLGLVIAEGSSKYENVVHHAVQVLVVVATNLNLYFTGRRTIPRVRRLRCQYVRITAAYVEHGPVIGLANPAWRSMSTISGPDSVCRTAARCRSSIAAYSQPPNTQAGAA